MLTREEIIHGLEVEWGFPPSHIRGISEEQMEELISRLKCASYNHYLAGTIGLWRMLAQLMREGQSRLTGADPYAEYDALTWIHNEWLSYLPLPEILEQYELARRELLEQVTTVADSVIADIKINKYCQLTIFWNLP